MEEIRLQKFMAENGIASRRKCEEYIKQGKIKVNGEIVTELGTKVNPEKDIIYFSCLIPSGKSNSRIIIFLSSISTKMNCAKVSFVKRFIAQNGSAISPISL